VCQSFDATAEWDGAIRNKLQQIFMSIDRGANGIQNAIERIVWMIRIPVVNLTEEIFIKNPGLR
jgi:hypothetical protein